MTKTEWIVLGVFWMIWLMVTMILDVVHGTGAQYSAYSYRLLWAFFCFWNMDREDRRERGGS